MQQQLYFFAFIVGVVTIMKYVDAEFSNQAVILPLYANIPSNENLMDDLIQADDVQREQRLSAIPIFEGCTIPPSDVWQAVCERDAHKRPTKTKILKQVEVVTKPRLKRNEEKDSVIELHELRPSISAINYESDDVTEHIYVQDDRYRT